MSDCKTCSLADKETGGCTSQNGCQVSEQGEKQGHGLNNIKHIIAVMSGKGGVGKSTVTALLATAIRKRGYKVGILDADITGPSIPKLFGLKGEPEGAEFGILPVKSKEGIEVISINLLLPSEDDPVIWRGPVISGVIKQFFEDVIWGELDYLLIDLPPGTGDAPLTVMQSLPLNGAVVVTSPQDLANMVVRKAIKMAQKMDVPILGIVENMSYLKCPGCEEILHPFGKGKAGLLAKELDVPVLGTLPLESAISSQGDLGEIEKSQAVNLLNIEGLLSRL